MITVQPGPFHDSKQYLGLQEPQVRCAANVERAHPMAWFVTSLTVLWYADRNGKAEKVNRDRPWYEPKTEHTFTKILGALRSELLRERFFGQSGDAVDPQKALEMLIQWAATVR